MKFNVTSSNNMGKSRVFFGPYISTSDNRTSYNTIKLLTKNVVMTPKYIVKPLAQGMIDIVSQMGKEESQSEGLQFNGLDDGVMINDPYNLIWQDPYYEMGQVERMEDSKDEDYDPNKTLQNDR